MSNQAVMRALRARDGAPRITRAFGRLDAPELEIEADRAAERVLKAPFALAAGGAPPPAAGSVQRKCAKCDEAIAGVQKKCAKCESEEKLDPEIQRAPEAEAVADPMAMTASPSGPISGAIVEDGLPTTPDQMERSAFVETVRSELTDMANAELMAVHQTAEGCPYIQKWLDYYARQPAEKIERAMSTYVGLRSKNARVLIDSLIARARSAIRTWIATGRVSGIPQQAPDRGLESPPAVASEIQRKADTSGGRASAPKSARAIRSELGSGRPIETHVRSQMERGFGRSFDHVRVHTDAAGARAASHISARAFTLGHDIAFAAGEYQPDTVAGGLLLAHELAHTVQQGTGGSLDRPLSLDHDASLEDEADRAAAGALGGRLGFERIVPRERSGLRLQGCTTKAKACPKGLSWYPKSTIQWGSFGCTCLWKCLPSPEPEPSYSGGPSITCANPPCGDPYDRVSEDYSATGYGASFTPLGGEPACGCFALDIEGNARSDQPLVPVTIDMTTVVGPMADVGAAAMARRRATGSTPETDPITGTRVPGKTGGLPPLPSRIRSLQTSAVTSELLTAETGPRFESALQEGDPAILSALEATVNMPKGDARSARLRKVLGFTEQSARQNVPETITEGPIFGEGGTGTVAEVVGRPDLASKQGAGRAATEAAAMVELELIGVPTVYLAERKVGDSPRLILRRIDGVGSKEIIGRRGAKPEDVAQAAENSKYVNDRTISDLDAIYKKLSDANLNVGDFQFIVQKSDGAVFVNDPTGVTPGSRPSGDISGIIDQFRAIVRRRKEGKTE
jgi:hypothetical protein